MYLTLLDIHVLLCFAFLVANAVENVIYPVAVHRYGASSSVEDIFVAVYFITFIAYHIIYFGAIYYNIWSRNKFFELDLHYEYIRREVQTVLYQQHRESREGPGHEVLAHVLHKKGLNRSAERYDRDRKRALQVMSFNPISALLRGLARSKVGATTKIQGGENSAASPAFLLPGDINLINERYEKVKVK